MMLKILIEVGDAKAGWSDVFSFETQVGRDVVCVGEYAKQ